MCVHGDVNIMGNKEYRNGGKGPETGQAETEGDIRRKERERKIAQQLAETKERMHMYQKRYTCIYGEILSWLLSLYDHYS